MENKKFTIIKKVAKHGSQSIVVIPRLLEQHLKPGTIIQLNIEVLSEASNLALNCISNVKNERANYEEKK